jgi:hypothetical protein
MKTTVKILAIIWTLIVCSRVTNAQGIIQTVIPSEGIKGQQMELVIMATGTQFSNANTNVSLGQGIVINNVIISNSFTLRINITIDQAALSGSRTLTINSGNQVLNLPNAFEVLTVGNNLMAILEIVPVQTLYASDFDPNNPALAPLLFRVNVMNDQVQRNLKVVFSLLLENEGLLGKAFKSLPATAPAAIVKIDNRQFESYEFSPSSRRILQQVQNTGILPAGTYTYRIEVFDDKNNLLVVTEEQNVLTNQSTDIVLISPGNPTDMQPEVISAAQPIFQWISSANQFDLLLFKVEPGQSNTQQILQSMPVFKQLGITVNTLIYPLSAELLESGKTYAWHIRSYINTAKGNLMVESPLYWFSFSKSNVHNLEIVSFKVTPEQTDLATGGSFQFRVEALNAQGQLVPISPVWKVAPLSEGSITNNGLFKAGNLPKTIAVVAEYGSFKDYAVVNIKYQSSNNSQFDLMYQLFGNPNNIKKGGNK